MVTLPSSLSRSLRLLFKQRDRVARAVTLFPILFVLLMLAVKVLNPHLYRFLCREDNLVEDLTFLAYVLACPVAMSLACDLRRQRRPLYACLYGLLSAGLFVIAMEEISWGQRLFHETPPEFFAINNYKGETNLHNLSIFPLFDVFILVGGYGALARPFLHLIGVNNHHNKRFVDLMTPTFTLFWYFFLALSLFSYYRFLLYYFGLEWKEVLAASFINSTDQEPIEMLLSFGFLLFVVANKYAYRHARQPVVPAGAPDSLPVSAPARAHHPPV